MESVSRCMERSAVLSKTKIPSQRLPFTAQISHGLRSPRHLSAGAQPGTKSGSPVPRAQPARRGQCTIHTVCHGRGRGFVPWCSVPRGKSRTATSLLWQWGTVLRQNPDTYPNLRGEPGAPSPFGDFCCRVEGRGETNSDTRHLIGCLPHRAVDGDATENRTCDASACRPMCMCPAGANPARAEDRHRKGGWPLWTRPRRLPPPGTPPTRYRELRVPRGALHPHLLTRPGKAPESFPGVSPSPRGPLALLICSHGVPVPSSLQ